MNYDRVIVELLDRIARLEEKVELLEKAANQKPSPTLQKGEKEAFSHTRIYLHGYCNSHFRSCKRLHKGRHYNLGALNPQGGIRRITLAFNHSNPASARAFNLRCIAC